MTAMDYETTDNKTTDDKQTSNAQRPTLNAKVRKGFWVQRNDKSGLGATQITYKN